MQIYRRSNQAFRRSGLSQKNPGRKQLRHLNFILLSEFQVRIPISFPQIPKLKHRIFEDVLVSNCA
jgi:hypothetical protein